MVEPDFRVGGKLIHFSVSQVNFFVGGAPKSIAKLNGGNGQICPPPYLPMSTSTTLGLPFIIADSSLGQIEGYVIHGPDIYSLVPVFCLI